MYLETKLPVVETETKPDPFTLPALIAWLRTKPADEAYNFMGCDGTCLIGQYLKFIGYPAPRVAGAYWRTSIDSSEYIDLSDGFRIVARRRPYTFGAALARAEALL